MTQPAGHSTHWTSAIYRGLLGVSVANGWDKSDGELSTTTSATRVKWNTRMEFDKYVSKN